VGCVLLCSLLPRACADVLDYFSRIKVVGEARHGSSATMMTTTVEGPDGEGDGQSYAGSTSLEEGQPGHHSDSDGNPERSA
jgi:hypothetical protein